MDRHIRLNQLLTAIGMAFLLFTLSISLAAPLRLAAQAASKVSIIVTNSGDDGPGSLRQAIKDANSASGDTTISFNADSFPPNGKLTIALKSEFPEITTRDHPITISGLVGTKQAPASIEIDGIALTGASGFKITGKNVTIRDFTIDHFAVAGVLITGDQASNNHILANIISKNKGVGVRIEAGATLNVIGVPDSTTKRADAKNIIVDNDAGGVILTDKAAGNVIAGNYIGVDGPSDDVLTPAPNTPFGVLIENTDQANFIGTNDKGSTEQGNYIGDNKGNDVLINDASHQVIAGNHIFGAATLHAFVVSDAHPDPDCGPATTDADPAQGCGVVIRGNSTANTIGAFGAKTSDAVNRFARNYIYNNTSHGIYIADKTATGNRIAGNFLGIDDKGEKRLENGGSGVFITSASGTVIGVQDGDDSAEARRNVISGSAVNGITLVDLDGTVIAGNYIGVKVCGCASQGNSQNGIEIRASKHVVIGAAPDDKKPEVKRNLISGNGKNAGIYITKASSDIQVAGNYIGLDSAGSKQIPNAQDGILIDDGSTHNLIGWSGKGDAGSSRNIIASHPRYNVGILGAETSDNQVAGNYIGTNSGGNAAPAPLTPTQPGVYTSIGVFLGQSTHGNFIGGRTEKDNLAFGNLIAGNSKGDAGLVIRGANENHVTMNLIGTQQNGTSALANSVGVLLDNGASGNVIGVAPDSKTRAEGNVIAGNSDWGVHIVNPDTQNNIVAGNIIGLDKGGKNTAVPNGVGVEISDSAHDNLIGTDYKNPKLTPVTTIATDGNLIAGNLKGGIVISNSAASNRVAGNFIGLDIDGQREKPNGENGVQINGEAHDNIIGTNPAATTDPYGGNLIAGNKAFGLLLDGAVGNQVSGNLIGATVFDKALPNHTGGLHLTGGAHGNTIGGVTVRLGNRVLFNEGGGVTVDGAQTLDNLIQGNTIASNKVFGLMFSTTDDLKAAANKTKPNRAQNNWIASNVSSGGSQSPLTAGSGILLMSASPLIDGNTIADNAASGIYLTSAPDAKLSAQPTIGKTASNAIYANCAAPPPSTPKSGKTCAGIFMDGDSKPANVKTLETDNPRQPNSGADFIGPTAP